MASTNNLFNYMMGEMWHTKYLLTSLRLMSGVKGWGTEERPLIFARPTIFATTLARPKTVDD